MERSYFTVTLCIPKCPLGQGHTNCFHETWASWCQIVTRGDTEAGLHRVSIQLNDADGEPVDGVWCRRRRQEDDQQGSADRRRRARRMLSAAPPHHGHRRRLSEMSM